MPFQFRDPSANGLQENIHKQVGGHEDQQDADDQAVQTGGLGDGAAHDHGRSNGALALGLTADGFTGVAFTNTGADTGDQSETRADGAAGENDTNSEFHK